jgi:hypothetical protein
MRRNWIMWKNTGDLIKRMWNEKEMEQEDDDGGGREGG